MFRVGEIVFHREYEVRGVVLGWDREARAPLSWLRQVYSEDQTSLYIDPHYTVICDTNQVTRSDGNMMEELLTRPSYSRDVLKACLYVTHPPTNLPPTIS